MNKYKYRATTQFRRDLKLCKKRGYSLEKLTAVINLLLNDGCLPSSYKPHKLAGTMNSIWECHIQSDWLLLWQQLDDELIMLMTRTGTHSDIFNK